MKKRHLLSITALMMAVMMLLSACTFGQTSHVRIDNPNSSSSTEQSESSSRPSGKEDAKNESDAKKVIQLIDAIGTVTLNSETAINRARTAYDALSEAAKALVTNYQTLVNAEMSLENLKSEADSSALREKADYVIGLISALFPLSFSSDGQVAEARAAYDALPEDAKALVTNYQTLLDAEAEVPYVMEALYVVSMIESIGTVTLDSESMITAARSMYEALSAKAKEYVSNYQTLLDAEAVLEDLKQGTVTEAMADAAFSIYDFWWGEEDDGYYIILNYTNKDTVKTITELSIEIGFTDDKENPIIMDGFTSETLLLLDHDDIAPGQSVDGDENFWGPVTCTGYEPTWVFIYSVEITYTDGSTLLIDGDAIYAVCDWN